MYVGLLKPNYDHHGQNLFKKHNVPIFGMYRRGNGNMTMTPLPYLRSFSNFNSGRIDLK